MIVSISLILQASAARCLPGVPLCRTGAVVPSPCVVAGTTAHTLVQAPHPVPCAPGCPPALQAPLLWFHGAWETETWNKCRISWVTLRRWQPGAPHPGPRNPALLCCFPGPWLCFQGTARPRSLGAANVLKANDYRSLAGRAGWDSARLRVACLSGRAQAAACLKEGSWLPATRPPGKELLGATLHAQDGEELALLPVGLWPQILPRTSP